MGTTGEVCAEVDAVPPRGPEVTSVGADPGAAPSDPDLPGLVLGGTEATRRACEAYAQVSGLPRGDPFMAPPRMNGHLLGGEEEHERAIAEARRVMGIEED